MFCWCSTRVVVIAGAAWCVARDTVVRALNALPFRGVFFSLFPSEMLEGFLFNRNSRFLHGGVCVCATSCKVAAKPVRLRAIESECNFITTFVVSGLSWRAFAVRFGMHPRPYCRPRSVLRVAKGWQNNCNDRDCASRRSTTNTRGFSFANVCEGLG